MELVVRLVTRLSMLSMNEVDPLTIRNWASSLPRLKRDLLDVELQAYFDSFPVGQRPLGLTASDSRAIAIMKWIRCVEVSRNLAEALKGLPAKFSDAPEYKDRQVVLTVGQARQLHTDLYLLLHVGKRFCLVSDGEYQAWQNEIRSQIARVRRACGFGEAS